MHKAIVTKIKVTPHPNADRLAVGYICGETVIVGKDTPDGELGVYFNCELQLSKEFAQANDLIRRKDADGNDAGGFFEENRRVRIQKFRGVKSHGFWMPISCLKDFGNYSSLKEGDQIDTFNNIPLCCKYISNRNPRKSGGKIPSARKKEVCFPEHLDTQQLKYNINKLSKGDELIISLKIHGTSQRTGYILCNKELTYWEKWVKWLGFDISETKLDYLNGTRRVVIKNTFGNPFHGPELREQAASKILPFLEPYMIAYYEVIGYEPSGASIMPKHNLGKLKEKELIKQYGETITYTYGCAEGQHDVYVYRIVWVLPNGKTIDLSWDEVKEKCNSWGVKHVPELQRFVYDGDVDKLILELDNISDGPDPIDSRHIREGICVRVNKPGWFCFKNKGWTFKVAEGIIKEDENYVDLEEES